jgi:hypothetical protein
VPCLLYGPPPPLLLLCWPPRRPEALIPIMKGCQRLVVVGEHKQLPPVIKSREAEEGGLSKSLFERLMDLGAPSAMLQVRVLSALAWHSLLCSVPQCCQLALPAPPHSSTGASRADSVRALWCSGLNCQLSGLDSGRSGVPWSCCHFDSLQACVGLLPTGAVQGPPFPDGVCQPAVLQQVGREHDVSESGSPNTCMHKRAVSRLPAELHSVQPLCAL